MRMVNWLGKALPTASYQVTSDHDNIIEDGASGYFGEGKISQSLVFKIMSPGVMMMLIMLMMV